MMTRRCLLIPGFLIVLLHCSNLSIAQTTDSSINSTEVDSTVSADQPSNDIESMDTVVVKQYVVISNDSLLSYKSRKEFGYIYSLDSLLKQSAKLTVDTIHINNMNHSNRSKKQGASAQQESQSSTTQFAGGVITIFLWFLAIGFILFVLYKLFLGEGMFKKESTRLKIEEVKEEVALEPSGYDSMITEAISNKNFRLAVRYHYLQLIQKLSLAGVIQFSADKTNYDYVRELATKSYHNDFAKVTLNYEYAWYGHFEIDEDVFSRIRENFKLLNQKI